MQAVRHGVESRGDGMQGISITCLGLLSLDLRVTIAVLVVDSKNRGPAGLQPPLLLTLHCHCASLHGLLALWEMGPRANAGASQVLSA